MGVYTLVFLGGAPIGSPLIGWIAEQFGPRMSLISGGVISAIAAVVAGIVLSHVTRDQRPGRPAAAGPAPRGRTPASAARSRRGPASRRLTRLLPR